MDETRRILIVEDEESIREALRDALLSEGYEVLTAADGTQGLALGLKEDPDLVVLDLMLPKLNGTEVLRTLREGGSQVPVLCLTAKSAERDRVAHLVAGADDYVTKPFSTDELVARVRAILRRTSPPGKVEVGGLVIDFDGHSVTRGERVEKLSALEAGILQCLVGRRGKATSRAQILDAVWGRYAAVTDRTIDFHVKNIRRKIEADPEAPQVLVTDHGVGYRFAG